MVIIEELYTALIEAGASDDTAKSAARAVAAKPNHRPRQRFWVAIGALVLLAIYLCGVIVRVENERYALLIGMCYDERLRVADPICLTTVQTRTNALWHLFYAITD